MRRYRKWSAPRRRSGRAAGRLAYQVRRLCRSATTGSRAALRLELLDLALVLQRGYAWLADTEGVPITRTAQLQPGQPVRAELSDGEAFLTVDAWAQAHVRRDPNESF